MVIAHNSGLAVHHVTVHDLGGKLIVSIDLEVDGGMQLDAAHDIAHNWNAASARNSARTSRSTPISSRWSRNCRTASMRRPSGRAIKAALSGFAASGDIHDIHNVRVRNTDAGEIVNFHCRAAPSMSVIKVHEHVDEIERALRRAFPTIKRVISHAEPPRVGIAITRHVPVSDSFCGVPIARWTRLISH